MKTIQKLSLAALLALSTGAFAADEESGVSVSGSATLTSNYIWRGASYSLERPTAQAGLDVNDIGISGLSASLWGSGYTVGSEIDGVLNYSNSIGDSVAYDVGYILYYYTSSWDNTYGEAYLGFTFFDDYGITAYVEDGQLETNFLTLEASATFGPVDIVVGNYFADESVPYASIGYTYSFENDYSMNFMVAYNDGVTNDEFGVEGMTLALSGSKSF